MADPSHGQWIREVDEEDEGDEEREDSHDDRIIDQRVGHLIDSRQHETAHYQEHEHAQGEKDLFDNRGRGPGIDQSGMGERARDGLLIINSERVIIVLQSFSLHNFYRKIIISLTHFIYGGDFCD